MDLLSVLQLQEGQIQSQAALIELRDQLANRINLHLALGGGFDISPATAISLTTAAKTPYSSCNARPDPLRRRFLTAKRFPTEFNSQRLCPAVHRQSR
jgi:hypothetical protein